MENGRAHEEEAADGRRQGRLRYQCDMQLVVPLTAREAADVGRFGPKAANLARMDQAGLPTPGGFCLDAEAYRTQVRALGLEADARGVFSAEASPQARRHALAMKLGLLDQPITPAVLDPLLEAWHTLEGPIAVRSSALVEDRFGSSFAGQFESFLGIDTETDFVTAVRSCWGALWATRALRYMATHDIDPADTAMAVLIQPVVNARASGGGLSRSPDRYELSRDGALLDITPGRKDHQAGCIHHQMVAPALITEPCLGEAQAVDLGRLLRQAEDLMAMPVEIEWAMDDAGFKLLQARPLHTEPAATPDAVWLSRPRLNGHAAGVGWGEGRACVIQCECELSRVAPGDILVTRVASPALSHVLTQVAGVVAERGGSTSHMASLARERGTPMVLGVLDATRRIPNGSTVAVDGVAGVVRWMN
jgi:pyruvate,water dikinase